MNPAERAFIYIYNLDVWVDADFSEPSIRGPGREGSIVCCVPDAISLWFSLSQICVQRRASNFLFYNTEGTCLTSHFPVLVSCPDDKEVLTIRNVVPLEKDS